MNIRRGIRYGEIFLSVCLALFIIPSEVKPAQVSNEARRETVRLERLSNNLWEGLVEEHRFGSPVDKRIRLDVFNFLNGVLALRRTMDSRRAQASNRNEVLDLLLLQSETVDRSLQKIKINRLLLRDWDTTKTSLDSLARLLNLKARPTSPPKEVRGNAKNVNELQIEIREIRAVGNFFKQEYRIRGAVSGRNIVSAGIYSRGQQIKTIPVRLHDRNMNEASFSLRMKAQEGITVRLIDSQGLLVEKPVKFPAGGGFPGLR